MSLKDMFSNKNSKNKSKPKKIGGKIGDKDKPSNSSSNEDLLNQSSTSLLNEEQNLLASSLIEESLGDDFDNQFSNLATEEAKSDFDDFSFNDVMDGADKSSNNNNFEIKDKKSVATEEQLISPSTKDFERNDSLKLEFDALDEIYGGSDATINDVHTVDSLSALDKSTVDRHTNKIELDGLAALDISTKGGFGMEDILASKDIRNTSKKSPTFKKKEQYKKSLFGNMSVKSQYTMFFTTLVIGAVGLSSSMFYSDYAASKEYNASKLTSTLSGEKEKFNSHFRGSLVGINGSYQQMLSSWSNIERLNASLQDSIISLENSSLTKSFEKVKNSLNQVATNVEYVKGLEMVVKGSSKQKDSINKNVDLLLELSDKLIHAYLQTGGNSIEIAHINALKMSLKDLKSSVNSILLGENITPENINDLSKAKKIIETNVNELSNGAPGKGINKMYSSAMPIFEEFNNNWNVVSEDVSGILKNADALSKAKLMVISNTALVESLSDDLKLLTSKYNGSAHGLSFVVKNVLIISILLLLISLGGLAYVYNFESEKKEKELKSEADKNKKSVLKLLNDMSGLQDGDLTKKTTVEEGITLDIADSINATIDSLAVVVKKIKNSSFIMKQKTNEINSVSTKLLQSTEKQSSSIIDANEAINNIAKAITEISEKTKESLITAQNSADASHIGAIQVKESIESMNAISKNMDETVGLMKKVSDSSQQISEVVNLLSDITEETNILALNAAVQAAKSGEAGKGFKVVADSIQELADNAADATRRVGALIAAVQTDIQSVGTAIERTNKEVARGVNLSENAGKSLSEITEISNKLTEIVKSISKDANINAAAAKQISHNMSQILKVTEETRESTKQTTSSIGDIDKMSNDLSESVKTFKV